MNRGTSVCGCCDLDLPDRDISLYLDLAVAVFVPGGKPENAVVRYGSGEFQHSVRVKPEGDGTADGDVLNGQYLVVKDGILAEG